MAKKRNAESTDETLDASDTTDANETGTDESTDGDEAADLTGLVKMRKEGQTIHAHPDVIEHHQKNGWKRA